MNRKAIDSLKACLAMLLTLMVANTVAVAQTAPRIVNFVNFIRKTDYRLQDSELLLYEATAQQVKMMRQYNFPATFLLQYDALISAPYQRLLSEDLPENCEVGAWWELTKPQVEAAGIEWRGNHSWVSTANIAFSTGYTPEQRERLVDVYMSKFREVFGRYPQSVGSWFIDAHTLAYMYDKYGIVASCNCKDQIGTDGYTLWGGYWNQAYYPSRNNAYMPAQTTEGQIPIPIFRMLGSDPIYQYDDGLGGNGQGVITLEPVYAHSGKNRQWVEYFLESMAKQPCLAFGYAQAGQENSFTWNDMREGLQLQAPIIDRMRREGSIELMTLGEAGRWFRSRFPTTPPTAVTALKDVRGEERQTVWYNCRNYRANVLVDKDGLRFRDIHLFDERFRSDYLQTPGVGGSCYYYTLPFLDGMRWSAEGCVSGMRFVADGQMMNFQSPIVEEIGTGQLRIIATDSKARTLTLTFGEEGIEMNIIPASTHWELQLSTAPTAERPFVSAGKHRIDMRFKAHPYTVRTIRGKVTWDGIGSSTPLSITSEHGCIRLLLSSSPQAGVS